MSDALIPTKHDEFAYRDTVMAKSDEQTMATLPAFLTELSAFDHDYGTICYAVAAAALGAARALDRGPSGGITGFQAGVVMWEFIAEWQHLRGKPLRLVNYADMLFPQHDHQFAKTISRETWAYLQAEATKNLAKEVEYAHPAVRDHWAQIVRGVVPFGYVVRDER